MATHVSAPPTTQSQKTLPFVSGSVPLLGNLPELSRDRLALFQRVAQTGDVCGLRFGPFPTMLFNKPEHIQSILVEHAYDFDKGIAVHASFRPVIGDGLHEQVILEGHVQRTSSARIGAREHPTERTFSAK